MKKLITAIAIFAGLATQAAEVRSARYIVEEQVVELDVSYGGGCKEHYFELEFSPICLESYPVQCGMKLHHDSNGDFCEAYIHQTIKLPVKDVDLTDSYFNGAYITVRGDNGTSASFSLPFVQ